MNVYVDNLLKVMAIVFLFVVTLFLISFLVEYVKMLWLKHKINKNQKAMIKEISKIIDTTIEESKPEDIKGDLEKKLKKSGIKGVSIDDVKVVKLKDEPKKKRTRKKVEKSE